VPASNFVSVVGWIQHMRIRRFVGADLELHMMPNVAGARSTWDEFGLWSGSSGQPHSPINLLAVYSRGRSPSPLPPAAPVEPSEDAQDDSWAFTCSEDGTELCGVGPFFPNTTCRAAPLGMHLHLYFRQNDAVAYAAKVAFKERASAALGIGPTICADNTGHEQPHDHTCWLSGPGGREADYPQDGGFSSFATGTLSLCAARDHTCSAHGHVLNCPLRT
jgi:hypothetical protein